jgi:hypothetical protein
MIKIFGVSRATLFLKKKPNYFLEAFVRFDFFYSAFSPGFFPKCIGKGGHLLFV